MTYPGDEVARAAFDVMLRRGWGALKLPRGKFDLPNENVERWVAWIMTSTRSTAVYRHGCYGGDGSLITAPDPFTALVEADRWYKENVEKKS